MELSRSKFAMNHFSHTGDTPFSYQAIAARP